MQEPRSKRAAVAWGAGLFLALLLLHPVTLRLFGWAVFELVLPSAILVGSAAWVTRLCLPRWKQLKDEFAEEESARRARLASLRGQAEQMEITLRDLKALSLDTAEAARAHWAETELEEALQSTQGAMARERAALFMLDATRWLTQIEPLLQQVDRLDEPAVRHWLNRLTAIRAQGVEILVRIRTDLQAVETAAGVATINLLEEALAELESLRAELLTRRARLLVRRPADALDETDPSPTLQRLREVLCHARARREVSSWTDD